MYKIRQLNSLKSEIRIPPDKSILHRAIMISSLCKETTCITPFFESNDILATLRCVEKLGAIIDYSGTKTLRVKGNGLYFPAAGKNKIILNANESGTTMRILTGILCAQKFPVKFTASLSLSKRPMGRVVYPLKHMGANFENKSKKEVYPPLLINPTNNLNGQDFNLPIASAQVKSAIMLASLYAKGKTTITEPYPSRDHTERMLSLFKADINVRGRKIICKPAKKLLSPGELYVPSDFSSAAFFIILGLILPNTKVVIKNVNINPTRSGLLRVLQRMKADIKVVNKRKDYEMYADLIVKSSKLKATTVYKKEVPSLIDEIPILCVAAAFAKGETKVIGVNELKVKETDRLNSIVHNLGAAGIDIRIKEFGRQEKDSSILIKGTEKFKSVHFKSFKDHRTAMSAIILGTATGFESTIDDIGCINKSFPQFISLIESL